MEKMGVFPYAINDGKVLTNDDIYEAMVLLRDDVFPKIKQAIQQGRPGARREFHEVGNVLSRLI